VEATAGLHRVAHEQHEVIDGMWSGPGHRCVGKGVWAARVGLGMARGSPAARVAPARAPWEGAKPADGVVEGWASREGDAGHEGDNAGREGEGGVAAETTARKVRASPAGSTVNRQSGRAHEETVRERAGAWRSRCRVARRRRGRQSAHGVDGGAGSSAAAAAELSYVDLDGWSEGDEEGKKRLWLKYSGGPLVPGGITNWD
jgi:hypothetical protein